ncbi:MAG TPA: TlpA disulfide reductase family protein [Thermoanaerobaculia bacterium]|nr:TlpA disulfide reductase family protein [Thermoanaerobaculia bacterium]
MKGGANRRRTALNALPLLLAALAGSAEPSRIAGELDAKGLREMIVRQRGRVVLVNFWATWCVPCREEFPELSRLQNNLGSRGLQVLGVSTDLARETPGVERFLDAQRPSFPNYRKRSGGDDQDFIEAVDPSWQGELPFSVLYARDGHKVKALSGKHTYAQYEKEVSVLLNRPVGDPRRSASLRRATSRPPL